MKRVTPALIAIFVFLILGLLYLTVLSRFYGSHIPDVPNALVFSVGERTFTVNGGMVSAQDGARVPLFEKAMVLRVAYAYQSMKTDPLFSLEGTDLALLERALDELERTRDGLASLQEDEVARKRVANDIFPIPFLRELVLLEEMRRNMLAAPSDTAYAAYEAQLDRTIAFAIEAVSAFRGSYTGSVHREYERTAAPLGLITATDTVRTLDNIKEGYARVQEKAQSRARCVQGFIFSCEPLQGLDVESLPRPEMADEARMWRVTALYDEARQSYEPERSIVGLERSACLKAQSSSDYIEVRVVTDSPFLAYAYLGDIFLRRFTGDTSGETLSWFARQGMTYLPYNPFIFYTCPQVASDISRAKAITRIADLLGLDTHSVLYESDVLRALDDAIVVAPSEKREELASAYRAYRGRTAGFEDAVQDIVHGLGSSLAMNAKGIPVDASDGLLFSTHSGYYTLFLAHNHTFGALDPKPYSEDPESRFFEAFFTFGMSGTEIDAKKLIHDMSLFFGAHST